MKHEAGENGGFRRFWSKSEYSTGGEIIKFQTRRPIGKRKTAGLNPPVFFPLFCGDGGYTAGFGGFGGYDSNASGLQGACGEETRGVEAEVRASLSPDSPRAREDCGNNQPTGPTLSSAHAGPAPWPIAATRFSPGGVLLKRKGSWPHCQN